MEKTLPGSTKTSGTKVARKVVANIVVFSDGKKTYRAVRRSDSPGSLPSYADYMRQLNRTLRGHKLSSRGWTIARAFAKAVYRRSLARRVRIDVEATVAEAVARATQSLGENHSREARRSTYAYKSGRSG